MLNNFINEYLPQILFNIVEKLNIDQRRELHDKIFLIKTGELNNLPDMLENLVKTAINHDFLVKVTSLALDLSIQDLDIRNTLIQSEVLTFVDSDSDYDMLNLMSLYGCKLCEMSE